MWEFVGAADEPMFLIIPRSHRGQNPQIGRPVPAESLSAGSRERLIVYGALTTLADGEPIGVALVIQARDRETVDALLVEEKTLGAYTDIEVHDWKFGGRR